jgi:hypothetical protein
MKLENLIGSERSNNKERDYLHDPKLVNRVGLPIDLVPRTKFLDKSLSSDDSIHVIAEHCPAASRGYRKTKAFNKLDAILKKSLTK